MLWNIKGNKFGNYLLQKFKVYTISLDSNVGQDKDFITKAEKDDGISPYTDAIGERMEYQLYH